MVALVACSRGGTGHAYRSASSRTYPPARHCSWRMQRASPPARHCNWRMQRTSPPATLQLANATSFSASATLRLATAMNFSASALLPLANTRNFSASAIRVLSLFYCRFRPRAWGGGLCPKIEVAIGVKWPSVGACSPAPATGPRSARASALRLLRYV